MKLTHPKCGKSWNQRGNRTGHCSKCHETFEGITLFDRHQRLDEQGRVICLEPETMNIGTKDDPVYPRLVEGTWRGPKMPDRLKNTYEQMAAQNSEDG